MPGARRYPYNILILLAEAARMKGSLNGKPAASRRIALGKGKRMNMNKKERKTKKKEKIRQVPQCIPRTIRLKSIVRRC